MADLEGQSTDRIPIDTNPYTARVLLRGSASLTTAAAGGGASYFIDNEVIDLSAYDYASIVPEAEVYVEGTAGDGSTTYSKVPFVQVSNDLDTVGGSSKLTFTRYITYSLQRGTAKTAEIHGNSYTLRLVITMYSATTGQTATVHWQIKSTEAAPF